VSPAAFRRWPLVGIAVLALWRLLVPVMRCGYEADRWTEQWLPWQRGPNVSSQLCIVDITAMGLQLAVLAALAYITWRWSYVRG